MWAATGASAGGRYMPADHETSRRLMSPINSPARRCRNEARMRGSARDPPEAISTFNPPGGIARQSNSADVQLCDEVQPAGGHY